MSQNPQPSPQPTPQPFTTMFDPKSIKARRYPRLLVGALAIWCFGGIVLMFFGTAVTDTLGLVLTVAEAIFIVSRDREGFYTGAGFWKVAEWSSAQRTALAVLEIPFYFLELMLYVVRVAALEYQMLEQPAPLTPPAKRKRPQR